MSLAIDTPGTPGAVLDSVKCLRLPGLVLAATCPECGAKRRVDLGKENRIEYPTIGAPFAMHFGCYECDHEWSATVQLDVSFRVLTEGGE